MKAQTAREQYDSKVRGDILQYAMTLTNMALAVGDGVQTFLYETDLAYVSGTMRYRAPYDETTEDAFNRVLARLREWYVPCNAHFDWYGINGEKTVVVTFGNDAREVSWTMCTDGFLILSVTQHF